MGKYLYYLVVVEGVPTCPSKPMHQKHTKDNMQVITCQIQASQEIIYTKCEGGRAHEEHW